LDWLQAGMGAVLRAGGLAEAKGKAMVRQAI
jgi:hypothetical protein